MKTLKKHLTKSVLFTLFIAVASSGCGKSDPVNSVEEEDSGAEHTYNITLVNKADPSETIKYTGSEPIDKGNAIYKNLVISGERDHSIYLLLGEIDGSGSIYGDIALDDDKEALPRLRNVLEKEGSLLTIRPKGSDDHYTSLSGTITLSDLKYALALSTSGAASFTLKFKGDFEKNNGIGEGTHLYEGTGTILISPNKKMGTYKTP